jgi:hypothetical protein
MKNALFQRTGAEQVPFNFRGAFSALPKRLAEAILLHRKRFFLYGFFSDLHKKAVEKMN